MLTFNDLEFGQLERELGRHRLLVMSERFNCSNREEIGSSEIASLPDLQK